MNVRAPLGKLLLLLLFLLLYCLFDGLLFVTAGSCGFRAIEEFSVLLDVSYVYESSAWSTFIIPSTTISNVPPFYGSADIY